MLFRSARDESVFRRRQSPSCHSQQAQPISLGSSCRPRLLKDPTQTRGTRSKLHAVANEIDPSFPPHSHPLPPRKVQTRPADDGTSPRRRCPTPGFYSFRNAMRVGFVVVANATPGCSNPNNLMQPISGTEVNTVATSRTDLRDRLI